MGWPSHKYGWIVLGGFGGPLRDNGRGDFYESQFAEVFLDRKCAEYVCRSEKKRFSNLSETAPEVPPAQARNTATKKVWLDHLANVRIIRIALPGTYAQFKIPGRLERELAKEARVCDLKPRLVGR